MPPCNPKTKSKQLKKMKKLWRRASGAFKDTNSICLAKLARRTAFHHPELETAVIKATSHDESSIDYKNARRVFEWIRTSPSFLKPLLWALTKRVEKTRSWVVALKGLLLMHGVICCKVPYVQKINRIPFDLSSFHDGHSNSSKTWGFNTFVRAYFAFLDRRVAFNNALKKNMMIPSNKEKERENSMAQLLDELERSQALLDLLMQIRPEFQMRNVALILEVMDCTLDEIFYIYSRICNGVAAVLMRIHGATQGEARTALCVLHKAASQGAELAAYFEFCRDIGVLKASEFPIVEQIPDEDIQDLERIIIGVSTTKNETKSPSHEFKETEVKKECMFMEETKEPEKKLLKTVVTDNWVAFDDGELPITVGESRSRNPFEDSYQSFPPLL